MLYICFYLMYLIFNALCKLYNSMIDYTLYTQLKVTIIYKIIHPLTIVIVSKNLGKVLHEFT